MSDEITPADTTEGTGSLRAPLAPALYTADPSARVFEGRLYVYCSHDVDAGIPFADDGAHFGGMADYHLLTMESPEDARATDLGAVLHVDDVPWAVSNMWAPDAATDGGRYYLYFPAKDADGVFRIGVATADTPEGPFVAEPEPMAGTYSIDPAAFPDEDGTHYLYFGGLWGGQLQQYRDNVRQEIHGRPSNDPTLGVPAPGEPALGPRVARLRPDMLELAEPTREVTILDENGEPLREGDPRRYFEGPWMHRYQGRYYLSWSTGESHLICYGVGDDPYGPFTYEGIVLRPVVGWTTQHSIVEVDGRWWIFYHDALASGGATHLRSVKVAPLEYDADGRIVTVEP